MKLTLFFLFLSPLAYGATTIALENFDDPSTWPNPIASSTFEDPSSPGEGLFIQMASDDNDNFSGNSVFGRDLQGETGEPTLDLSVFTFAAIDTSEYTNLTVSFDFAVSANVDVGSFEIFLNGVGLGAVEFFNDPDSGTETGSISIPVADAANVALALSGTLNSSADTLELDNFTLSGDAIPEPTTALLGGLSLLALLRRRR